MGKLTAKGIATLKKPGRYHDGANLYLSIGPTGSKSWSLLFMLNGRSRQMGLGPLSLISLAEARELAFDYRRLLLRGVDPIEHRRANRGAPTSASFREFADEWISAQEPGWRNPKSSAQWRSSLKSYAYPTIGDLPVEAITTDHLITILTPIWASKSETANRVRNRIGQILDAAKARGLRTGDNPADWRGNLKHLLPAQAKVKSVRHHEALPYAQLPAFMVELRHRDGVSARALEFTILTAARTGEVIGARWSEIDLKGKVWVVPAARMKAGREHRVPLSKRALEILKVLPREEGNAHVFIGAHAGKGLSNMSMLELLRGMQHGLTVHGFRSSFRDWASEATTHPRDVVEMALAHAVGDKVEAAYRRGDLFEKRAALMADWEVFCLRG